MIEPVERRAIQLRGIVQGVGFRPFVHALASRLGLSGFVANHAGAVEIEVEGDASSLAAFEHALTQSCPPLARVQTIHARAVPVRGGDEFTIEPSRADSASGVYISPDVATCDACLHELWDPADRRHGYPFINCTACGPRLTIITGSPYDRARTTMAAFDMCGACRAEYENPSDRRFHAEPIACTTCGPRLIACNTDGVPLSGDPIARAVEAIVAGKIVAVKGLGGFHLACDAANATAVAELRRRKHRDDKPFAVMVGNPAHAKALCGVSSSEENLLQSPARPVVLVRRRPGSSADVVDGAAPATRWLGLMLPYTPVHHLLMAGIGGRALVLTSGNRSDEPIVTDNLEATSRLAGIADLFVLNDRAIHVRCDDSVVRESRRGTVMIRRSRGYAPAPITLPFACPEPVLAVGGHLKNTFALGRGSDAFLSHHIGDLDDLRARDAFERDVALFEALFEVQPRVIAHDAHPDYASTRFALAHQGSALVAVQHHHAHVAACMTEHRLTDPVIGIAWDGAGWGPDGNIWGGEFLVGDCAAVARAAHFRYVPLPGGDRAARESWRMALAHLHDAGVDDAGLLGRGVSRTARAVVTRMIERGVNAPLTSSVGRLFDAVAAICGGPAATTFEGQAAMWLESQAEAAEDRGKYPFDVSPGPPAIIDTRPLIRQIAAERRADVPVPVIARRFHRTLAEIAAELARDLCARCGISSVALSGGVFLNAVLARDAEEALVSAGLVVYCHHLVPPGDGGISLGQLAVAVARARAPQGC